MKRSTIAATAVALALGAAPASAQTQDAPEIPFVSVPNFLKYPPTMNLGETLAVAENSKGHIILLNHPGTATTGPLYGNATTNLLEFDDQGNFLREISQRASTGWGTGTRCGSTTTTTSGSSTRGPTRSPSSTPPATSP